MEGKNQIGLFIVIGTIVIVLLVLMVLFLAVFYQANVMKIKRKEAELLLKTSLESEKNERQRIAADIHDGVSGDLNAIRNFIAILLKSEKDIDKQEMFAEIKNGVEAAIENTRLVSYKLMPPLLEKEGIVSALIDYFERINVKNSFQFKLENRVTNFYLNNEFSYELFRVIQEFTTNMMKYGSLSRCEVIIAENESNYIFSLVDDGISFNFKETYKNAKGTGLKNISSRLKVIDAELHQLEQKEGNHIQIVLKKEKYENCDSRRSSIIS